MNRLSRARLLLAGLALGGFGLQTAHAYVHFLRYVNRDGRTLALPTRFDLSQLPNRTVPFYIAVQGPERFASGDSLTALASQIRLAAQTWSEVETSELRLAYGGHATELPVPGPGIDIGFGDIPPGLLALAGVTTTEPGPGASFVPIQRSQIILARDLTEQPSFAEQTFLTLVHEFGHALGLQHTQTASVMSTALTRAQTKARPLAADDVAGISLLYPTRAFQANTGAIAGRVTRGGVGLPLASVVALATSGVAVGALTHPDGTYRIDGLPPGNYAVYVQPLPAPQAGEATPDNLLLPLDPELRPIQPVRNFDTLFFPGVQEPAAATLLPVTAGAVTENVNFMVTVRTAPLRLAAVQSYSFPGQVAVRPAVVNIQGSRPFFVATGNGILASPTQPAAGLQVSLFGSSPPIQNIRPYSANFLQFDLGLTADTAPGVRHGLFTLPGELYVQPAILTLTAQPPPQITQVTPVDPQTLILTGSQLTAETVILADGVPAILRAAEPGRLTVSIPPAPSGHRMVLTALNPDGQSSLFLQGGAPPTHQNDSSLPVALSLNPASLPAGVEAAIEITALNPQFTDGWVTVAFGSPDVVVRRTWVLSPTRLLVQVLVPPTATPSALNPVVICGLRTLTVPGGFTILPGPPRLPISLLAVNSLTGIGGGLAGGPLLVLAGGPAAASSGVPTITISDRTATAVALGPGIFSVTIPPGLAPGPAILRIQSGAETSLPFAIQIDPPAEVQWEANRTVAPGEIVSFLTTGFSLPPLHRPRATVTLAGIEHLARIQANGLVTFTVLPTVPAGNHPLTLAVDGRTTPPVDVTVR